MNKTKITTITIVCLLMLIMTGCSGKSSGTETPAPAAVTQTPVAVATIDPEIHTDNIMGIYIGKKQFQIGLGLDTTAVEEVLGKADEVEKNKKTKAQSWYYKKLDTTLTFRKSGDSYTITSIKGGKKAVTLKTGGGITIGAKKQDIKDAYQEQLTDKKNEKKDRIIVENNGYSRLVFVLDQEDVVGIVLELLH